MTTIAVAKKNGHVAIAADTLTKGGYIKVSADYVVNHQKILRVQDSYLAITGASSAKLALANYFVQTQTESRLGSVAEIFETWLALHQSLKEKYYLKTDEDENTSFESTRMDVLIANPRGIFGVAAHRAVEEFSRFFAEGQGGDFALGAMFAAYDDAGRSAKDIVELGIRAAAEFDDSTGLPIISYTVPLAGST